MAQIHVLDPDTIDKIAAGEVVERPASVVKELVENAIDSGADAVTVEVKEGGIEYIRVTDNGCGMERDQLRTAFLRHATSKIADAKDLQQIASLGFRGEALSSIAAVSRTEVITKPQDCITGSRILLEGGRETGFEEVGAPDGTTFIMRNLFYNTPVRRKFLKQAATEGGYIVDLMEHLALSRPDISFKLTLGGQLKFHTSGSGDLKEVIYRIYGRETANALIPMQVQQGGIKAEGYLGKSEAVRSNRNFEIYFLNGRFIRSGIIAKAVEEGYKGYLMQHKFPLCVLHITMDPRQVDVNVHPTKMDVRFSDGMDFARFLTKAVQETLHGEEMIPEASLDTDRERKAALRQEAEKQERVHTPEPFERHRTEEFRLAEDAKYAAERRNMQDFIQNPAWQREKTQENSEKMVKNPAESPDSGENPFFSETSEISEVPERREEKAATVMPEDTAISETAARTPEADAAVPKDTAAVQEAAAARVPEAAAENSSAEQLNLFEEKILTQDNRARFRIIGQVFETYWLVQYEDKLLMIDQHAAHEKVNFERLMKQYREKAVVSQTLMPPVIVSLSGQEETVLKEHLDTFFGLGFEVEAFGGNEYALRSVPADLYGCNEREMFLEVLDGLAEGGSFGNLRVVEEKIASMSCKAAVKGNHLLSVPEAEALIDELLTLDNPYNCPHGRPTIVSMTKYEMERKFKRVVN